VDTARDAPWQFATSSKPRTKDGNQRRGGHKVGRHRKAKCCVTLWSLLRISIFRPDVGFRSLHAVEHGIRTENQNGVCVYVCVYVCVCLFVCVCVKCVCVKCVYNVYVCVRARVYQDIRMYMHHTHKQTHTLSQTQTPQTQKFKTNGDGRPAVPGWYLLSDYQRLFEGVQAEEDEENVEISGTIPSGLNGVYFVTGPGIFLQDDRTVHPFDGHGLVRRFEIDGRRGKVSFKSRFVRTPVFEREMATLKSKRGTNIRYLNAGLNAGAIPILQRGIGTNVKILRNVIEGRFGEFLLVHRNPSNTWCVCVYVCVCVYTYTCVHVCTHIHTHTHTHTHTCIHTHAHTH